MIKTMLALAISGLMVCACNSPKQKDVVNIDLPSNVDKVKRGANLVASIGCADCHSPKKMTAEGPVPGIDKFLSGHPANDILAPYDEETAKGYVLFSPDLTAAIGPWGTSFAANLTPDKSGIGTWSEEQFLKAMKEGKWKGLDGS